MRVWFHRACKRRGETTVSVEQPDAWRGIIGVYQIEMITALSQSTPSALRLPSELNREYCADLQRVALSLEIDCLTDRPDHIKDKYTVYTSRQVCSYLGLCFPGVILLVRMGNKRQAVLFGVCVCVKGCWQSTLKAFESIRLQTESKAASC